MMSESISVCGYFFVFEVRGVGVFGYSFFFLLFT